MKEGERMKKYDRDFLNRLRTELDVELIGVAQVETSPSEELKKRAARLLPTAKSVVVVGKETYREVVSLLAPIKEVGEAEPGELLNMHAEFLNGRLNRAVHDLSTLFKKEGYRSLPLPAGVGLTDQRFFVPLLSYKHAAHLAGLGSFGRHSLLITPEFGPRARFACVLTEASLEATPILTKDFCKGCDACIRHCPAKAIEVPKPGESYAINRFACRAYRQAGLVCSVCMKVCDEVLS
jgi:epoxyqueuosine reductase QueG